MTPLDYDYLRKLLAVASEFWEAQAGVNIYEVASVFCEFENTQTGPVKFVVRGFDGESFLSAERGWLLRNELALALGESGGFCPPSAGNYQEDKSVEGGVGCRPGCSFCSSCCSCSPSSAGSATRAANGTRSPPDRSGPAGSSL